MSLFHHVFSKNLRWYRHWHKHPRKDFYHWSIFLSCLGILAIVVFSQTNFTIAEIDHLRPSRILSIVPLKRFPLTDGSVVGAATDRILINFREGSTRSQRDEALKRNGLSELADLSVIDAALVSLAPGDSPSGAINKLLKSENAVVESAELDAKIAPSFIPNDPNFSNEWHHTVMHSPAAWDTVTGSGVIIGIADSGVDMTHPDLLTNLTAGWNFYDNNADTTDVYGHGTAVAGTAAAVGNNAIQVAGGAFSSQIMPLRVTDTAGYGYYSTITQAITYAADHGVKVVNASFQIDASSTIARAARYLKRKGGLLVESAGNYGAQLTGTNNADIVMVAATDPTDLRMSWSNYGTAIDVAAPGFSILTTLRNGEIGLASGTSFAAPLTAGVLALIWSVHPAFTPDQAKSILYDSAVELGTPGWDTYYGWGRVDAARAVDLAVTRKLESVTSPGKKK